jgi:predicted amino acid-binding ACT domain protein
MCKYSILNATFDLDVLVPKGAENKLSQNIREKLRQRGKRMGLHSTLKSKNK